MTFSQIYLIIYLIIANASFITLIEVRPMHRIRNTRGPGIIFNYCKQICDICPMLGLCIYNFSVSYQPLNINAV